MESYGKVTLLPAIAASQSINARTFPNFQKIHLDGAHFRRYIAAKAIQGRSNDTQAA
jgi:hypothetical protein